jgi:transcriptional regulator with XRE-family HTH domain
MEAKEIARKKLGNTLRDLRTRKGISQYAIYRDGWCGGKMTSKVIESGDTNYTIDTLTAYLNALGVELNIVEKAGEGVE